MKPGREIGFLPYLAVDLHHNCYGIRFQGETEGQSANEITYWEDMDEITGNPTVRFVKCRIEAV